MVPEKASSPDTPFLAGPRTPVDFGGFAFAIARAASDGALIELGSATRLLAFQDHPFSIRAVSLSVLAGRLASMEAADERIPDTADAAGALQAGRAPEMVVGAVRGHAGFQL